MSYNSFDRLNKDPYRDILRRQDADRNKYKINQGLSEAPKAQPLNNYDNLNKQQGLYTPKPTTTPKPVNWADELTKYNKNQNNIDINSQTTEPTPKFDMYGNQNYENPILTKQQTNPSAIPKKTVNWVDELKEYEKNLSGHYGYGGVYDNDNSAFGKWKNYGTVGSSGNVFGDDFKFNEGTDDIVKSQYDYSKNLYGNSTDNFNSAMNNYNKIQSNARVASDKAYINKMVNLKNQRELSTALGKGGLGTTESGYKQVDNNYYNTINNIKSSANDSLVDQINRYLSNQKNNEYNAVTTENNAKTAYGNYLLDYGRKAYGDGSEDYPGSNVQSNLESEEYEDIDGKVKMLQDFLNERKEEQLQEELGQWQNKNKYFLDGNSHRQVLDQFGKNISSYGSGKEGYGAYFDGKNATMEQQREQKRIKEPVNFKERGAVANINAQADIVGEKNVDNYFGFSFLPPSANIFGTPVNVPPSSLKIRSYNINGEDIVQDRKANKKERAILQNNYSNAVIGDIVWEDSEYYLLDPKDNVWKKMETID